MYSTRESNNFFLSLFENSTDLISIIDAEGYYRFVGGSMKPMLGYTPEEMTGLCAFSYIHEDDLEQAATALSVALHNKVTTLPYLRFRTKWGEWRWVECTVTNMVDNEDIQGYVTNSRDVTERVKEEQRKKKSQVHYESLFHNHPDAIFELDKEGYFCKINRHVSEITGYEDAQIMQAHFRDIVLGNNLPLATAAFNSALAGWPQYLELSIVKQSGELATVGITIVPVLLEDEVQSIQGIAKDITILKKYDTFVKERAEQLNTIMERVSASFYSLDSNWCFTSVNAYFKAYLGKSKAELIGRSKWELFPLTLGTRFYSECLKVLHTGTPTFSMMIFSSEKSLY